MMAASNSAAAAWTWRDRLKWLVPFTVWRHVTRTRHKIRRAAAHVSPAWAARAVGGALEAAGLRAPYPPRWPQAAGEHAETLDTPRALWHSFRRLRRTGLRGDYYEFGLYRGYAFWYAQSGHAYGVPGMRFFGFDSFAGLPEPDGIDDNPGEFRAGDYAYSKEGVRGNLDRHGVDWSRTFLVEGFFDRSLVPSLKDELRMGPVAIALIDCDLYASTVPVLDFIADRLQDGSILLFDDWNCFDGDDDKGERRAMREFLWRHPEWKAMPFVRFGWHGQGFIMRKAR